jgi:hypothetical protein
MSVTKIPAPSGRVGVITDYRRVAMSVAVDGQNVVYQFDEADPDLRVHVRVIDPRSRGLLGEVGPSAVSGELGDGEAILGETVQLGTPAEQALALAAIPHIYRELRDPRERKALRGLYNRLASAAADR